MARKKKEKKKRKEKTNAMYVCMYCTYNMYRVISAQYHNQSLIKGENASEKIVINTLFRLSTIIISNMNRMGAHCILEL